MIEAGMDVARLNFSHGSAEEHAETAEPRARRREPGGAPGRDPAGPAGAQAAHRQARRRDRRAQARRPRHVRLRRARRRGRRAADVHHLGRAGRHGRAGARSSTSPTAPCACASPRRARATARSTRMVEIGGSVASRQGLNIPGETAALPSVPEEDFRHLEVGEKIGVDLVASQLRAPRGGHRARPQAHAAAADREDREAAGGPARGGDRARGRLRDGRARRPRHRDADRGGADRPEADHRAGRRARPAR